VTALLEGKSHAFAERVLKRLMVSVLQEQTTAAGVDESLQSRILGVAGRVLKHKCIALLYTRRNDALVAAKRAGKLFYRAYTGRPSDFSIVNAATMHAVAEMPSEAKRMALKCLRRCESAIETLLAKGLNQRFVDDHLAAGKWRLNSCATFLLMSRCLFTISCTHTCTHTQNSLTHIHTRMHTNTRYSCESACGRQGSATASSHINVVYGGGLHRQYAAATHVSASHGGGGVSKPRH
jgi:hypothetical protein